MFSRSGGGVPRFMQRLRALVSSGTKEERLVSLRQEMEAAEREFQDAQRRLEELTDADEMMDLMDDLLLKYGDGESIRQARESRAQLWAIQAEGEAVAAIHRESNGDCQLETRRFQDFLAVHPGSCLAHLYLGAALERCGDLEGSLATFRKLTTIGNSAEERQMGSLVLGQALHRHGESAAAATELREGIERDLESFTTTLLHFTLGEVLLELGDGVGARTAWEEVIRRDQGEVITAEAKQRLEGLV
jgi:tetratricopeptide (TPR) repeat protein